jgi:hypothetical protein
MDERQYWSALVQEARNRLAASPYIYPGMIWGAVQFGGGIGPYIAGRVPDGDLAQVDREVAFVYVCRQLCQQGLGWVSYTPPAVVTTTA